MLISVSLKNLVVKLSWVLIEKETIHKYSKVITSNCKTKNKTKTTDTICAIPIS